MCFVIGSEFPIDIPYPDDSEEEEADDLGDDLIDETQSETGVMQGKTHFSPLSL